MIIIRQVDCDWREREQYCHWNSDLCSFQATSLRARNRESEVEITTLAALSNR